MKTSFKTPLGICEISGDEEGISEIKILDQEIETSEEIPAALFPAVNQLKLYFQKELEEFSIKTNPKGTEFQKKVWKYLQEIPYGTTNSYMELSRKLGDPKAIRAVAAANGKNPLWILVPCHRVIGSDGSLTGYAGGLWRKKMASGTRKPHTSTSSFLAYFSYQLISHL